MRYGARSGMTPPMGDATNIRRTAFIRWMNSGGLNPNRVAKASGVPYMTLKSFVEGATASMKGSTESKIAEAFELSVDEIFAYDGNSAARPREKHRKIPVIGYVGAATEYFGFDDHEHGAGLDEIDAPPGVPDNAVAVIVRGDSGYPAFRNGMVLIYWTTYPDPTPVVGEDCFVRLTDGRTLVKILERGSAPGLWTLNSINAAVSPIRDVRLEWAAPIEIRLRRVNWAG